MSLPARDDIAEQFRQDAMDEAHRQMVWRGYCEARTYASKTDDIAAGKHAQAMYVRWLRLGLTDPERRVIELENEVVRLSAENRQLRGQLGRRRLPVPQWREPPAAETQEGEG